MYCPNCGTVLPDSARACPTCGIQFAVPLTGPGGSPQAPAAPVPVPAAQTPQPTVPVPQPGEPPVIVPEPPIAPQPGEPPVQVPQPPAAPQPGEPPAVPAPAPQPYATQPLPVQPPYATQPLTVQPQPYAQQPGVQPPYAAGVPGQPQPGELIPKKKRTGLIIAVVVGGVVVVAAAVAAFFLLRPPGAAAPTAAGGPVATAPAPTIGLLPAYAPVPVDTSFETTTTGGDDSAENTAAENAVVTFYETINSGDFAAVEALVTADTRSAIDPGAFEGWSATTFEITRSIVNGDTGYVFGRESQRAFGSKELGVKFTLKRENGTWLIETWQAVDEATVNGGLPSSGQGAGATALTEASARDIVSSLLQARQVGDSETIRQLTTASFQTANGAAWLDGIDNSEYFTKFTIKTVKKSGAKYVVTVSEVWPSGTETATYTVIDSAGTVLVDGWTSK